MEDLERAKRAIGGELTLTDEDMHELSEAKRRVFLLMKDGAWHTPGEIRRAAGKDGREASEGLRRLRSLRGPFSVEKRRESSGRMWVYRLVPSDGVASVRSKRSAGTIFYLVDLEERRLLDSFDGRKGGRPPEQAVCAANRRVIDTGHACVLARGELFFQRD